LNVDVHVINANNDCMWEASKNKQNKDHN